jgi:hypothetical protein
VRHPARARAAPAYFACVINDAERLMQYAAEIGLDISNDTRHAILTARAIYPAEWTEDAAANLLAAVTALSARLKPVTAESLKAYHDDTRPAVRSYLRSAIVLACIIIPVSVASFVTSAHLRRHQRRHYESARLRCQTASATRPPPAAGEAVAPPPKGSAKPI